MRTKSSTGVPAPASIVDISEPVYGALCGYAGKINGLLATPLVQANLKLAASLDDLLGAVYALIQANQLGFANRTNRATSICAVEALARQIATGDVEVDKRWLAGFYFNNALFRIAAVCHRVLQIVLTGKDAGVNKYRAKAEGLYQGWTGGKLSMVHGEVITLKHTPEGVFSGRTVTYDDASSALGELLALIEFYTAGRQSKTQPSARAPTP